MHWQKNAMKIISSIEKNLKNNYYSLIFFLPCKLFPKNWYTILERYKYVFFFLLGVSLWHWITRCCVQYNQIQNKNMDFFFFYMTFPVTLQDGKNENGFVACSTPNIIKKNQIKNESVTNGLLLSSDFSWIMYSLY